jgi:hypothetical protein
MPSQPGFWFNFLLFAIFMTILLVLSACSSTENLAQAPLCRGTAFSINNTPVAQSVGLGTEAVK